MRQPLPFDDLPPYRQHRLLPRRWTVIHKSARWTHPRQSLAARLLHAEGLQWGILLACLFAGAVLALRGGCR